MCEVLVCVKNQGTTGVLATDSHMPKQGDVVFVAPDGWTWGVCELGQIVANNPNGNHPFFRILKLANVTVAQASNMMTPELDIDPQNPSPYLQYRGRFLDKTKIPAGVLSDYLTDDTRAQPFLVLNFTAAQINAIVTTTDDANCPAYHARIAF
jgi:hypothetical protein